MKNLLLRFWPIIVCLILASFVSWPVAVPGYFSHHDDLQVMRIFEMKKCLLDLQIPCRWVPDMGYGNGYPLFNYYAVFPYYLGAFFSFFFSFLISAKLLFAIPIFLGAISMYLLASKLFGIYAGILASILYTYAPYRALDLFVRGDVAESFAIAIIPLVFYFTLKLIRSGEIKFLIGLSVSLAIFLASHNIMTVLFMPVFLLVTLYWQIIEKKKNWLGLMLGLLIGIGLAAFFIVPAYFEKNLVQIDNLIRLDLNFRAHFATIDQLFFNRFWGYGASVIGPQDTISFQLGWPHWWLACLSIMGFLISLRSKHKVSDFLPQILFVVFVISVFMTHIQSAFIWEKIDILKFTQFPWRFLAVSVFSMSLLGGYFSQTFKYKKIIVVILVVLTIILNWSYFRPKEFYLGMTDQQKLSNQLWDDQKKAAILDYLPQTAVKPEEPAKSELQLKSGTALINNFQVKSNSWQFQTEVTDHASIEVPVFDFPKWEVSVNNQPVSFSNKNYLGRITVNIEKSGQYLVSGKFTNTPIRTFSNVISILSLLSLLVLGSYGKINKNSK